MHNIEGLDDVELRDLVREQLAGHGALDIDDITVTVREGQLVLSGRVGTDGERRVAEHVLTDVLGIQEFTNDLVVDSLRRATSPLDIEEHLADEEARAGTLLGDRAVPLHDEAEHLADAPDTELSGTTDLQVAIERGVGWIPPESPTPEGMMGTDAGPGDRGEAH
jgi:hypothetical protein